MVAAAGRLRGGPRPGPRGPVPNGAARAAPARCCESGPLPALGAPARAERPKRGSRARPAGRTIPRGRPGGAPRGGLPADTSQRVRRGLWPQGHEHREARSRDRRPVATAPSRVGPGDAGKRASPLWGQSGPVPEKTRTRGPSHQHARPLGRRMRAARGRGAGRAAAMAAAADSGLRVSGTAGLIAAGCCPIGPKVTPEALRPRKAAVPMKPGALGRWRRRPGPPTRPVGVSPSPRTPLLPGPGFRSRCKSSAGRPR